MAPPSPSARKKKRAKRSSTSGSGSGSTSGSSAATAPREEGGTGPVDAGGGGVEKPPRRASKLSRTVTEDGVTETTASARGKRRRSVAGGGYFSGIQILFDQSMLRYSGPVWRRFVLLGFEALWRRTTPLTSFPQTCRDLRGGVEAPLGLSSRPFAARSLNATIRWQTPSRTPSRGLTEPPPCLLRPDVVLPVASPGSTRRILQV